MSEKFEKHNDMLFRMLEEPQPAKEQIMSKKFKHKIAEISLLITTLAETPLAISYVFRINIPHMNIAAGIGIIFLLIFLWSGR